MSKEFEPKEDLTQEEISQMKDQLEKITEALQKESLQNPKAIGQTLFDNTGKLKEDFPKAKAAAETGEIEAFKEQFGHTSATVLKENSIDVMLSKDEQEAARQVLEERNSPSNAQKEAQQKEREMIREVPDRGERVTVQPQTLDHDDADWLDTKKD